MDSPLHKFFDKRRLPQCLRTPEFGINLDFAADGQAVSDFGDDAVLSG